MSLRGQKQWTPPGKIRGQNRLSRKSFSPQIAQMSADREKLKPHH
jgi:hypothetical protein